MFIQVAARRLHPTVAGHGEPEGRHGMKNVMRDVVMWVFVWVGVLGVAACSERPTNVSDGMTGDGVFEKFIDARLDGLAIENTGKLHNEILDAFDRRHSLLQAAPISRQAFAQEFRESVNEVLRAHGIEGEVYGEDVMGILGHFDHLREVGVFDFHDVSSQEPSKLVADLADRGVVDAAELEVLDKLVAALPPADADMSAVTTEVVEVGERALDEAAPDVRKRLEPGINILPASRRYWMTMREKQIVTPAEQPRHVTYRETGQMLADLIGGLSGLEFGSAGAMIVGTAASLMFLEMWDNTEESDASVTLDDWQECGC